jgi:hypothetical protein
MTLVLIALGLLATKAMVARSRRAGQVNEAFLALRVKQAKIDRL